MASRFERLALMFIWSHLGSKALPSTCSECLRDALHQCRSFWMAQERLALPVPQPCKQDTDLDLYHTKPP